MKHITLISFFIVWLIAVQIETAQTQVPIVPEGVGFGINTVAGSGRHLNPIKTTIFRVTNLNSSGPGSLRNAIEAIGPRTVIFEVSGTIEFTSVVKILDPYITIAGQTAPSPGITIKGGNIRIMTHDVFIQHLRFRMGWDGLTSSSVPQADADALQINGNLSAVYNVVIDHCSFSWAFDETIQIWHKGVNDITLSNCLISESIQDDDSQGPGKGIIVGPDTGPNIFISHSIMAHTHSRHPRSQGNGLVFANNIVYNFSNGGTNIGEGKGDTPPRYSILNNFYKRGLDGDKNSPAIQVRNNINPSAEIYHSGNIVSSGTMYSGPTDILVTNAPNSVPGFTPIGADNLIHVLPLTVGARPLDRDAVDLRVINDVINGTGHHIESEHEVGGWPVLDENHRELIIPENPFDDDSNNGYTNLEEWLYGYTSGLEIAEDISTDIKDDKYQSDGSIFNPIVYPNPIRSWTNISYRLNNSGLVTIDIYDISGVKQKELVNSIQVSGQHQISWDGRNDSGQMVSDGVYFCKIHTGKHSQIIKIIKINSD